MALLRNPRHEKFSQLVADGASLASAYTSCGFSSTNAASGASRLAKNEKVRARIEELQTTFARLGADHAEITRAAILRGLWALAENKDEPAGARIRAYELCGKEYGMFVDRSNHTINWDGDLTKLDDSQLELVTQYFERIAYGDDRARLEAAKRRAQLGEGPLIIDLETGPPETPKQEPAEAVKIRAYPRS